MAKLGLQSESQRRFLRSRRPDVAAAWEAGRTIGGRRFVPRAALPIHSGARKQRSKRRRGRI